MISVVIPVKNGAATLERCLASIRMQEYGSAIEIIVIDSASEDDSKKIALQYNAKVFSIAADQFNHGLTRNAGVKYSSNELLYFTVQDAFLTDPGFFKKMSSHFNDAKIMGVTGHQAVAHEADKNPLLWFKRHTVPEVSYRSLEKGQSFELLPRTKQEALIAWDNVVAMYRRTALLELPFIVTDFAEDWIWSRSAIIKGWTTVYDPSLVVYHYHHLTYRYVYSVNFTVNFHFYKNFAFKPAVPPLFLPLAKAVYHLLKNQQLTFYEKCYWIFHNGKAIIAKYNSTVNFLLRLYYKGFTAIENGHKKKCKTVPLGKQKEKWKKVTPC